MATKVKKPKVKKAKKSKIIGLTDLSAKAIAELEEVYIDKGFPTEKTMADAVKRAKPKYKPKIKVVKESVTYKPKKIEEKVISEKEKCATKTK